MGISYFFARSLRKILPGLAMAPFALEKSTPSPSSQGSNDETGDRRLRMVRKTKRKSRGLVQRVVGGWVDGWVGGPQ